MSQISDSQNQRQRNGNYSAFRTNGSLILSSVAAISCLFILIAGIVGLVYSSSYFDDWTETTATIVGTKEMGEFEHSGEKMDPFNNDFDARYCPKIQFITVGEATPRNITTVLEFGCKENAEEIDLGGLVDILYDPSDPTEVLDGSIPTIVQVSMACAIAISAMCSCCYVVAGIVFYKATEGRNRHNSGQDVTASDNNNSAPSSVQMSNLNGNSTYSQYAVDPSGCINNAYTTSTSQSTTSAIPNGTLEVQAQPEDSPPLVSAYPEGTPAGTAIAAGDEAPPIVGCTLIPSSTESSQPNNQQYVSPSSLPANPQAPSSSYVGPSDSHEAIASA